MEPMIQEERAFSKMRTSAVQRLQNHLPMEIAAKSGALFHSEKKCLEIQSLNQRLEISLPEYDFTPYIEEWHQLVILHYLDLADGVKASEEQVSFGGLKDGLIREQNLIIIWTRNCACSWQTRARNRSSRSVNLLEQRLWKTDLTCARYFRFFPIIPSG